MTTTFKVLRRFDLSGGFSADPDWVADNDVAAALEAGVREFSASSLTTVVVFYDSVNVPIVGTVGELDIELIQVISRSDEALSTLRVEKAVTTGEQITDHTDISGVGTFVARATAMRNIPGGAESAILFIAPIVGPIAPDGGGGGSGDPVTNNNLPTKTSILKGWVPSISTGTTINLTAGTGYLVDNETDPLNPTYVLQSAGPFTNEAVLNVGTQVFTYFYIDGANLLQQQNTRPTRSENRQKQFVAVSYQPLGTVVAVYPLGQAGFEGDFFAYDMINTAGILVSGNVYARSTASALRIKVSDGEMGYANANRQDTPAARRDPHFVSQGAADPVASFVYVNNDGSDGITVVNGAATDIDTANRSNGAGGLTALANNRNGLAVIYRDPKGNTIIEYTIAEFNPASTTAEEAFEAAIEAQPLVMGNPFEILYVLEYPKDATDLVLCTFHRVGTSSANTTSPGGGDPLTRRFASEDKSTGIVDGGVITVNGGNPAGFDISDGRGWVVDSYSTVEETIVNDVRWTGLTNITPTNIATWNSTYIALDKTQPTPSIIEQQTDFTIVQRRDLIVLGRVLHTDNATITGIIETVVPSFDILMTVGDFMQSFGPFNLEGNEYSTTGANLIPYKSAGRSFKLGGNYHVSKKDPNRTIDPEDGPGVTGLTFGYLYRDPGDPTGFSINIPVTAYDPNQYDDGTGTLAAVPNNRWTFQTLYFFPQANTHRFHYGQANYATKQDAIDAITNEPIDADPFLETAVRRGWVVMQEGATDGTNDAQVVFLNDLGEVITGGGGGGGGNENGKLLAHYSRTAAITAVDITPVFIGFDSAKKAVDTAYWTFSAGTFTCVIAHTATIKTIVSFKENTGAVYGVLQSDIVKNTSVNIGSQAAGVYSTTMRDNQVVNEQTHTFAPGDTLRAYYFASTGIVDLKANMNEILIYVAEE